jgi:hypothetical protein
MQKCLKTAQCKVIQEPGEQPVKKANIREGRMSFSPMLPLHISAGLIGILSGAAAMSFRKGSPRHVLSGRVFVIAMLTLSVSAVYRRL